MRHFDAVPAASLDVRTSTGARYVNNEWLSPERLVTSALEEPGKLLDIFKVGHSYSLFNSWAIVLQCQARGLEVGPAMKMKSWNELGRCVRKGQSGLLVNHPIMEKEVHEVIDMASGARVETKTVEKLVGFKWVPTTWVFSQTRSFDPTEGELTVLPADPNFSAKEMLTRLGIELVPFDATEARILGWAEGKKVALNPLVQSDPRLSLKVLLHEVGHVVLGHTSKKDDEAPVRIEDGHELARSIKEAEAELVAFLTTNLLSIASEEISSSSRAYIQHWLGKGTDQEETLSGHNIRRVFKAVDKILGRRTSQ